MRVLAVAALATLVLAACERTVVDPTPSDLDESAAMGSQEVSYLPAPVLASVSDRTTSVRHTYACFESWRLADGRYRYRTTPLRFRAISPATPTVMFRYRAVAGGRIQFVANCAIPADARLVRRMEAHYAPHPGRSARADEPDGFAGIMGAGHPCDVPGACVLPPIFVDCTEPDSECYPGDGGGDGGPPLPPGDDPPPPGGPPPGGPPPGDGGGDGGGTGEPGDDPCIDCDPSAYVTLDCGSTVRGSTASCYVVEHGTATVHVGAWTSDSGTGANQSGGTSWGGEMAEATQVSVTVAVNGTIHQLSATIGVTPRNWRWNSSDWTFANGTGTCVNNYRIDDGDGTIGLNHYAYNCGSGSVYPRGTGQGYSVRQITGGPNAGLHYVSGVSLGMARRSSVHPALSGPGGELYTIANAAQAQECRQRMGLPPGSPVRLDFFTFNTQCKNVPAGVLHAQRDATRLHEAYGSTGTNGHQYVREMRAALPEGDAHRFVELVVASSEEDVHSGVAAQVEGVDTFIRGPGKQAEHELYVHGNGGPFIFWVYMWAQSYFAQIANSS